MPPEHNYLNHKEQLELQEALGKCLGGDQEACAKKRRLQEISQQRDAELEACIGSYSDNCIQVRQDLAHAAAEYLDKAFDGTSNLDELSLVGRQLVFIKVLEYTDSLDEDISLPIDETILSKLSSEDARTLLTVTMEEREAILGSIIGLGAAYLADSVKGGGGKVVRPKTDADILPKVGGGDAPNNGLSGLIAGGTRKSADDINASFPSDYSPPYKPGTQVTEFVSDGNQTFVRVYNSGNSAQGKWVMKQSDIEGLTPQQVADKYALPEVPTHITTIKPPFGTKMRTGEVNENFGKPGGGQQFEFLGHANGWGNGKPL